MRRFLFLDDWFLDERVDVVRRFARAVPTPIPEAHLYARLSIIRDEKQNCFRGLGKGKALDPLGKAPFVYASCDGINWRKEKYRPRFHFAGAPGRKVMLPVTYPYEQSWFYDRWDSDESRRYKMLVWPYAEGMNGGPGLIACSSDGLDWLIDSRYRWFNHPHGSDTNNNLFNNPFTRRWCVICRRTNNDRRIALAESEDLEHWTEPCVIIHPDALDAPLLQFYGLTAALYEDEYFIGALQCYNVPGREVNPWSKGRVKMSGTVDVQLAYSYDGMTWLRGNREPLIDRSEMNAYGAAMIQPSFIGASADRVFIYSIGKVSGHGISAIPEGYPSNEALLLHTLRRDGFACLESRGWGQITTRVLLPKSGDISINYQAPCGQVLVQISDGERKPVPGYSFEDCVPLHGDEIMGRVRWKQHADVSGLIGKPVRVELRLLDARLYALRLDCALWYGYWPDTEVENI